MKNSGAGSYTLDTALKGIFIIKSVDVKISIVKYELRKGILIDFKLQTLTIRCDLKYRNDMVMRNQCRQNIYEIFLFLGIFYIEMHSNL